MPELNVLLYGDTKQDAIQRAQSAAREIVLDRIAHGGLPRSSAAIFRKSPKGPAFDPKTCDGAAHASPKSPCGKFGGLRRGMVLEVPGITTLELPVVAGSLGVKSGRPRQVYVKQR